MMIGKKTLYFLTLLCGFTVANLYYSQTLFVLIGQTFNLRVDQVAIVSTVTQISYAIGLVLFVPLADIYNRKKLIVIILILNVIMQIICSATGWFSVLLMGSFFIGASSVTAQIVIPAITLLSDETSKGKNVGLLMSGLFSGVVFARMISGFIGAHFGWRNVYLTSACIDIVLILGVMKLFPKIKKGKAISYKELLKSLINIIFEEKSLRRTCLYGAISFSCFSALWGALDYLLSSAPYKYTSDTVGLFSLIGIFGVLASNIIGKITDRFGIGIILKLIPVTLITGFCFIGVSHFSVLYIILGMIMLDIASRASLLSNQLVNYKLRANIRSRVNTVFMSCYFVGGAIGTSIGSKLAVKYGWDGLVAYGMLCPVLIYFFKLWKIECNT